MSSSPLTRPPIFRQHSRVPGGFDTDEDLSPIKSEFDHAGDDDELEPILPNHATQLAEQNNTPLHARSEEGFSRMDGIDSMLDEREMKRKLMDVESSFLPEYSPVENNQGKAGLDDTFVFGDPQLGPRQQHVSEAHDGLGTLDHIHSSTQSPETPPDSYKTPAPRRNDDLLKPRSPTPELQEHANTSSLETMSSSPTAAAAARTVSRAVSFASLTGYETAEEQSPGKAGRSDNEYTGENEDATPRKNKYLSQSSSRAGSPTPTKPAINHEGDAATNGDIDDHDLSPPKTHRKRPRILSRRHTSQHSSYSSRTSYTATSTEGASEVTLGAEYALQTGGAVPLGVSASSSRPSAELSRSISLGSMASGISTQSDTGDRVRPATSTLDNLDSLPEGWDSSGMERNKKKGSLNRSGPQTPRARSTSLNTPTDTIINERVRNVEVPASIARRFQDRDRLPLPDKRNGQNTISIGRGGKNMTLKEQSSTIDKLQKENFSLKLKITFIESALDRQSDEGVKAMMSENIELRTIKFNQNKELKEIKRYMRELEQKLKDSEERKHREEIKPSRQIGATAPEVVFLRETIKTRETEIEKLRDEAATRESERLRVTEALKTMGERRNGGSDLGVREEMDMWKDLLDAESGRRQQADEDNQKFREEIMRLKGDTSSTLSQNNQTNGHRTHRRDLSSTRLSENFRGEDQRTGGTSGASTLVEQLRHENAELRREVGAQTSMLTSRNREKEHLWQQIEDLKLGLRRGDGVRSIAGDSILERSASRAHGRSASRASDVTRVTHMSDIERESYETKNGELRDQISELKLENQDLVREMERLLDGYDHADQQAVEDLRTMQSDRDQALRLYEDLEVNFRDLKDEAQRSIDTLDDELEQKSEEMLHVQNELSNLSEESEALRVEVRSMSERLVRIDDDVQAKARKIQDLELENEDVNREIESLERSLSETNAKHERLSVELESRQSEIAFLREDQDGDKIKIGDLETAIATTKTNLTSERDRVRDLETRLAEERHQREVIGSKEKQEVQKIMNDLNREISDLKEESRHLKKSLQTQETEAAMWKGRLNALETSLREMLGDRKGSKLSFLVAISELQRDLETTTSELERARGSLSERERLLQNRDALLESHGLESRKLSDLLEKERQGRRYDKAQHEQWQKTHQHTSRTAAQKETRIMELESARQSDRKKLAALEQQYKDQLGDRNNLLLALWNRLSIMCGTDWQHQNNLVDGHLPTLEVVSSMLPGFSKNLLLAVKTLEGLIGTFRSKIRSVERELWKDFQALEHNLDVRVKRLDRLESAVQNNRISAVAGAAPEIAKLKGENRMLKEQLAVIQKQEMHARASRSDGRNSQTSREVSNNRASMSATLQRHHSSSAVENLERASEAVQAPPIQSAPIEPSQQRWIHRLRELERRLKAEREARLLDRSGARKRLEERSAENEELRLELEREKIRRAGAMIQG